MADEHLMTAEQQALVRAVVVAINRPERPITAVDIHRILSAEMTPSPELDDVEAVVRILQLPHVRARRGESSTVVLGRILDVLEAAAMGEEYQPPQDDIDDRY
ncbi:hypothetical protein [Nocardia sp. NPDC004260]